MVFEVEKKGFQEEGVVTQEPASSKLIAKEPLQEKFVGTMV